MNIDKSKMLEVLKQCLPGIERGSILIEGSDAFLFANNRIYSFNKTVAVSVPIDMENWIGAVKAMDFFKLISKLNAPVISCEIDDSKLKLVAGRTKASIKLIESRVLEHIDSLELESQEFVELPETFYEALRLCKISGNGTPYRGIFISGKDIVSTDQSRINHYELESELPTVWIDDPSINELMKLAKASSMAVSAGWAHFKLENGAIFSTRIKDPSQYPKDILVEKIQAIQCHCELSALELPRKLPEALERVSVLAFDSKDASSSPIKMVVNSEGIQLYAENPSGSIEDSIPWDDGNKPDFQTFNIWVEAPFLMEACRKVMMFAISNSEEDGQALVFSAPNYTQTSSINSME